MNEQITNLIENVSNETINRFFKHKISSYYEDSENYDYLLKEAEFAKFSDIEKLGQAEFENADDLLVFSAKYSGNLSERSSKKQQYEIAKKVLREDFKDGAIFVFYDNEGRFRFSFLRKNYGDKTQKFTPWRRFTYFVNPENTNKTFVSRIDKCNFTNLDVIQEAFSVEPLSEQFYKDLSHWYFAALLEVDFPNDTKIDEMKNKTNAMIRLITRLIFVWFMKQKKLIPDDLFDKDKIDELINYQDKTGSTYYKAILQNLFFATLNIPIDKGRKFVNRQPGVQVFYRYKRFIKNEDLFFELMDKIPYLNGGLFENLDIVKPEEKIEIRVDCFSDRRDNETRISVPDNLFFGEHNADISKFYESETKVTVTGIIDLLKRYDFTIDENTPYDMEVALDPELLGLVFENLLASYNPETESTARKESGSFYTPRVVVDYMIEESLVNYLNNKTEYDYEKLKLLVSNTDSQPFETETEKKNIVEILSNIKILDPACGSGAFPMGALQKLVHVLAKLDSDNTIWYKIQKEIAIRDTATAYDIGDGEERKMRLKIIEDAFEKGINDPDYARKLFLIENCMYGVDIQPIAMQISKLRFFISLLVDQKPDIKRDNFGI
ncbi:MAG: restriction endonuclease subunit M, partial [Bacteroidales bacterium]|nr:restriction endonuclease subunit M [Bacteroidales bacterium]